MNAYADAKTNTITITITITITAIMERAERWAHATGWRVGD